MKVKWEKYWGNFETVNKMVYVAHVLNPRYKLELLQISFEDMGKDDNIIKNIIYEIKERVLKLYNEYKGVNEQEQSSTTKEITTRGHANMGSQSSGLYHVEMRFKRKREQM